MKTSTKGLALIQVAEGFRPNAYICPAGVLTIGYGHTGSDVTPGMVITEAQALALLRKDVASFEAAVSALVRVPLTQGQFDALVSFAFNLGAGALKASTLLRLLNGGDYAGAAAQFARWTKGGGKILPGLVKRRAAEARLFLS